MLLRTLEEGRKGVVAVMVAVLVLIKKSRATFKSWLITHTLFTFLRASHDSKVQENV